MFLMWIKNDDIEKGGGFYRRMGLRMLEKIERRNGKVIEVINGGRGKGM